MKREDAYRWARGSETGPANTTERNLALAILANNTDLVEAIFLFAGRRGANADTDHELRSAWEIGRAYLSGQG